MVSELRESLESLTDAERVALSSGKYTTPELKNINSILSEWSSSVAAELPALFEAGALGLVASESAYVTKLAAGNATEINAKKVIKQATSRPLAGGQLVAEMFASVAEKSKAQVEHAIRDGINTGKTNQEIVAGIRGTRTRVGDSYQYVGGILDASKASIDRTVRTTRSHVANEAYVDTWIALGYEYVKFISVLDGRTSRRCASLDQTIYSIDDAYPRPPLHFNCRSVIVGVDADGKLAGLRPFVSDSRKVKDIPKDGRDGKIGQVDANTSFAEFFAGGDKDFQIDWLGPTKYKLYKEGGYTIDRFVDPLGKEYTLKQLKALDEKTFRNLGL